jgi:uroporphyrinogen-III decarboxylase
MTGRERILAHLAGRPTDRLPLMPITMQFACAQIGARYRDYCTDYRVLVEGQLRTVEEFGFDYVNTMSDPAREAADCAAEDARAAGRGPNAQWHPGDRAVQGEAGRGEIDRGLD